MKIEQIEKLIILINEYNIDEIKIKNTNYTIKIKSKEHSNIKNKTIQNIKVNEKSINNIEKLLTIKSPIVGIFYTSPSPGKTQFVHEGKNINIGDTICIIEAMKVLNQIKSEYNCIIKKILVLDGSPVEYNQDLFIIKYA
ncbi:MAG: biotin/lipoyl-containing protein [Enterobacteriaceae bacterium]|nr:biotin/lipoyl-containing protein [Enterobacteriaceae bacterium]